MAPNHWVTGVRRFGTAWQSHLQGLNDQEFFFIGQSTKVVPSRPPETILPVTGLNIPAERRTTLHHYEDPRTPLIFCTLLNKSEGHLSCQTLHATPWHTIHCERHVAFSFTSVASALRVHNTLPVCAQIMSIFLVDEWFYLCDVPCPHVASVCCHPRDFRSSRLVCHLFHLHLRKQ
jgi:hypothetical protein